MELELRPEVLGAQSVNMRRGTAFDITGFKQHQDQFPLVQQTYDLKSTTQIIRHVINSGNDYLNDVSFWFYVDYVQSNGDKMAELPLNVVDKLYKCIRSVQIKVDGKLIMYVDYAKFLLDIVNQKKKYPDEMMYHKFDDVPFEYQAYLAGDAADGNIRQVSFLDYRLSKVANNISCRTNLTQKQIALYRLIQNARINRDIISEGVDRVSDAAHALDAGPPAYPAQLATDGEIRSTKEMKQKYCLFKLSDLGLWKSFPRFLVRSGIEIILNIDTDHFLINCSPVVGGPYAGEVHTTLKGLNDLDATGEANGAYIRLSDGSCTTNYTVPDERHLRLMLDQMQAGELTFPYYSWHMSAQHKATLTNSIDCSYSGSRIDRTYFTLVNFSTSGKHDR